MTKLRPLLNKHILPYFQLWKSRRDLYKLLQAVLYFLFCTYCVCLSNSNADRTNPNNKLPFAQKYSVPDVLLDALAPLSKRIHWLPRHLSDILVASAVISTVLLCLTRKENCCTLLKRFLIITGTLYLLRAPMISLTVLPTPDHFCKVQYYENIWFDALVLLAQQRVSCGDVFYSGHTIIFTSSLLLYVYNSPYIFYTICVFFVSMCGMVSLMYTSYHYTIDVVIAFILTFGLWVTYHWAAEIEALKCTPWGKLVAYWEDTGPPGTGRWKLGVPLVEPSDVPHPKWWRFSWRSKNKSDAEVSNDIVVTVLDLERGPADHTAQ